MSERIDEFDGAEIAVITFTDPARLDAYREMLGVPFRVVSDTDRELYRTLGLERGSRRQVWSMGTLKMYWRLLRSGRRLQRTHEDIRQLGADLIVGTNGRIATIFRPTTPDARPTVDELLAALRS